MVPIASELEDLCEDAHVGEEVEDYVFARELMFVCESADSSHGFGDRFQRVVWRVGVSDDRASGRDDGDGRRFD